MMSEVGPTSVPSSGFSTQVSGLKGRRAFLAALAAVLVLAIGLIVYGETRPLKRTFYGSVKDLLPTEAEVPGWKVEYLPIADTPEMQAKVNELLNYDDAVYAVYTKGTERISIYIAYWTPGKMSQRLIAGHTPDVCWVGAGWKILEAKSGNAEMLTTEIRTPDRNGAISELQAKSGRSAQRGDGADMGGALEQSGRVAGAGAPWAATDTKLKRETTSGLSSQMSASQHFSFSAFNAAAPAARVLSTLTSQISGFDIDGGEWRLMERDGRVEQVAFWHLSGDKTISYGVGTPKWHAAVHEASGAFGHRGEQVFIRVSTSAGLQRRVAQLGDGPLLSGRLVSIVTP